MQSTPQTWCQFLEGLSSPPYDFATGPGCTSLPPLSRIFWGRHAVSSPTKNKSFSFDLQGGSACRGAS